MTPLANLEREVKLDVGLHFSLPDLNGLLPGVVATTLPDAKLQATYIDTADLRLMRWGVTLRYRRDVMVGATGESGWTLKLPSNAEGVALVRKELSWPGKLGPVPPEVASMVRAHARTEPLGQVARLITQRHRVELRDDTGRKLAELDDDVVSVMDGRRLAARFRQVELEVTDIASEVLIVEVLNRLAVAGAVAGDDRPKVVRAIGARASLGPDVVVPDLGPKATVATVVAAAIAAGLTRIIRHDPGVRLGDDPEHVHQARVGTRRLRSDLWTFRQLLDPSWVRRIRAELGWLGGALGEVRDADVLTGRLRAQIRALPDIDARPAAALLRRLAVQRDEARARMLEALDSGRYLTLLDDLARAAADPPLAHPTPASAVTDGSTNGAGAGERWQPGASFAQSAGEGALDVGEPAVAGTDDTRPGLGGSRSDGRLADLPHPAAEAVSAGSVPPAGGAPAGHDGRQTGGTAAAADSGRAGAGRGLTAPLSPPERGPVVEATGVLAPTRAADRPAAPFPVPEPLGERRASDVLPLLVNRPWKHLKRAVDALGDDPPDEALHEVRILAKRVRYAAEAVAGVVGKPARTMAAAVAEVQGVLGDMQDAVVAETWLRRHVGTSGSTTQAMVAGELVTVQRQEQEACRKGWKRPWKAASRPRLRVWIKG